MHVYVNCTQCVYVCIRRCIHVHMCTFVCVCAYMCCKCACVCTCACVWCVCVWECVRTHLLVCTCERNLPAPSVRVGCSCSAARRAQGLCVALPPHEALPALGVPSSNGCPYHLSSGLKTRSCSWVLVASLVSLERSPLLCLCCWYYWRDANWCFRLRFDGRWCFCPVSQSAPGWACRWCWCWCWQRRRCGRGMARCDTSIPAAGAVQQAGAKSVQGWCPIGDAAFLFFLFQR